MKYINIIFLVLFVLGFNRVGAKSLLLQSEETDILSYSTFSSYTQSILFNLNQGLISNETIQNQGQFLDVLYYDSENNYSLLLERSNDGYYYLNYHDIATSQIKVISSVFVDSSKQYQYGSQRFIYNNNLKTAYLVVLMNNGNALDVSILEIDFGNSQSNFINLNLNDISDQINPKQTLSLVDNTMYVSYGSKNGGLNIASVNMTSKKVISTSSSISNIRNNVINYMYTNQAGQLFFIKPTAFSNSNITICFVNFGNSNSCEDFFTSNIGNNQEYNFQPYIPSNDNSILFLILYVPGNKLKITALDTSNVSNSNLYIIPNSNNYFSDQSFKIYFQSN